MIFLEEVLSVLTTPFVLWFALPNCSDKIVDFFREFTVHVDGIGYVCSFAVFDFERPGKVTTPIAPMFWYCHKSDSGDQDVRRPRQLNRDVRTDHKMEQSIMNFRAMHPDWMPHAIEDDDASAYVNRVNDPLRSANAYRMGAIPHQRRITPSQPYLGFAANSPFGQQSGRMDQSRAGLSLDHRGSCLRRPHPLFNSRANGVEESDLLRELDERAPTLEECEEPERFESELGDSFLSPNQAVREREGDRDKGEQGVFGLLNHLYQEAGTGKGIQGL